MGSCQCCKRPSKDNDINLTHSETMISHNSNINILKFSEKNPINQNFEFTNKISKIN